MKMYKHGIVLFTYQAAASIPCVARGYGNTKPTKFSHKVYTNKQCAVKMLYPCGKWQQNMKYHNTT